MGGKLKFQKQKENDIIKTELLFGGKNMSKQGINDEFYTPAATIINELKYYGYDGLFKNKRIYLPCDYDATLPYLKEEVIKLKAKQGLLEFEDNITIYRVLPQLFTENDKKNTPRKCQFIAYLIEQKEAFGIKDIFISGYDALTEQGLKFQNAPFNDFDVIITNPPFSQMNEWIDKIVDFGKLGGKFLFLAPLSITTNTYAFPHFKAANFWCGYTEPNKYEDASGNEIKSYLPSVWLTNMEVSKHKSKKVLSKSWKDHPEEFMPYWNYKAINVQSINDIPYDYSDVFGVPATMLKDLHPDQFEIIGLGQGKEQLTNLEGSIDRSKTYKGDFWEHYNFGDYKKNPQKRRPFENWQNFNNVLITTMDNTNPFKAPFCKILLRNKEIIPNRKYYNYEDVIKWLNDELKRKKPTDIWNSKLFVSRKNGEKIKQGKGEVNKKWKGN